LITAAVVPVAGLGTRLLPASRSAPKEMLPVVDKPVVQYVVEELRAAGIRRLLFITGRRKRAIEDHFDHDPQLDAGPAAAPGSGLEILYTRQPRPAGLGDALRHATGFAASGPVVVALGDAILQSPAEGPGIVSRLIEAYEASGAAAAVAVTRVADVQRYGVVLVRGESVPLEVVDLVEKPRPEAAPSNLAIAARYVLGSEVFAALADTEPDEAGEIQLTTALRHVIAAGGRVVAVPLSASERRHDIGTVEGYCTTFLEHALTHPRWGEQLRARAQALLDESG
jgi:UTP--glucose-1-phosphate uridylyltransferase